VTNVQDKDLHRQPAGSKGDDDDDDQASDTSFCSHRLGLLGAHSPATGDALRQQAADHRSVQEADGDQWNEEGEGEERAVEDSGVMHVTVDDALVRTRRSLLAILLELEHLPT